MLKAVVRYEQRGDVISGGRGSRLNRELNPFQLGEALLKKDNARRIFQLIAGLALSQPRNNRHIVQTEIRLYRDHPPRLTPKKSSRMHEGLRLLIGEQLTLSAICKTLHYA